jgi:hypothetical protein
MIDALKAKPLSAAAIDVLAQLFVKGPTWDGNITSKSGRGDLVAAGLAFHAHGWASLTPEGVRVAIEWDRSLLKTWHDQRWYRKAATID